MNLDRCSSITNHSITKYMVNLNIDSFDVLLWKSVYNFQERLLHSGNGIIGAIIDFMFYIDGSLYAQRFKTLYLHPT